MKRIVLLNKYSEYLSTKKNISDIEIFENNDIKFNLHIDNDVHTIWLAEIEDYKMPVVFLCNPKQSELRKPHQLYVKKFELMHLCLSVREDISVKTQNYKDIMDYTLKRIVKLLSLNENEEIKEFRKEFLYFWNQYSSNKEKVNLYIKTSPRAKKLNVYNKKGILIIHDPDIDVNSVFKEKLKEESSIAIYIPLVNSGKVIPPFEDKKWDRQYLEMICNHCVEEENIELLESIKIQGKSLILAFEMNIPETLPVTFVLKVHFRSSKLGTLFQKIDEAVSLEYISSQRCESEYLFKRIGMSSGCRDKNILVIGAGSLGSYIIRELPKIGVNKFTIFDNDTLSIENIMRHQLPVLYCEINKAFATKFDLETSYPELIVEAKNKKFSEKNLNDYCLDEYDLIIVTTGGTDFMLRLNKKLHGINLKTTVIYSWIEANGVGVHALPVDYSKKGCFQCLYTGTTINKAHYSSHNAEVRTIGTGCGGVFNPYGNLTLLRGSTMILEIIQLYLCNQLETEKNLLYSTRSVGLNNVNNCILGRRDFEKSKDFYIDERCEVCGTYL